MGSMEHQAEEDLVDPVLNTELREEEGQEDLVLNMVPLAAVGLEAVLVVNMELPETVDREVVLGISMEFQV